MASINSKSGETQSKEPVKGASQDETKQTSYEFDQGKQTEIAVPPSADSTGTLKPVNAAVKLQGSKFGRELFDVVGSGANVKRVKQLLATPDIAVNFEGENKVTPLMQACYYGNLDIVKLLIAAGADITLLDKFGRCALNHAASHSKPVVLKYLHQDLGGNLRASILPHIVSFGSVACVTYLLDNGVDVNTLYLFGDTPLMRAAEKENVPVMKLLIARGANVLAKATNGDTAIICAAKKGSVPAIELLISHGASIHDQNNVYQTALHWASIMRQVTAIEYLIANGVDWALKDFSGRSALDMADNDSVRQAFARAVKLKQESDHPGMICNPDPAHNPAPSPPDPIRVVLEPVPVPAPKPPVVVAPPPVSVKSRAELDKLGERLHVAAGTGNDLPLVLKLITEEGAEIEFQHQYGDTALMNACKCGNLNIVKALVDAGANVHWHAKYEHSAFSKAAIVGHRPVMDFLICKGVVVGPNEVEALNSAARSGRTEIVRFLLDSGDDVNGQRPFKWSPLQLAAAKGCLKTVELLVERGAKINSRDYKEQTPIMDAASEGRTEIVKYLLSKGASIHDINNVRETVLMCAANAGNTDLVRFLVEQGADVQAKNMGNATALHGAASRGRLEVVRYLVACGTDINAQNGSSHTALYLASLNGMAATVKCLVELGADVTLVDRAGKTAFTVTKDEVTRLAFLPVNQKEDPSNKLSAAKDVKPVGEDSANTAVDPIALLTDKLYEAAGGGDVEQVKQLLSTPGLRIDQRIQNSETALIQACYVGHVEVVRLLVEVGEADLNLQDQDGWTALHWAAYNGHVPVVAFLLSKGVDTAILSRKGATAQQSTTNSALHDAFAAHAQGHSIGNSAAKLPVLPAVLPPPGPSVDVTLISPFSGLPDAELNDMLVDLSAKGDTDKVKLLLITTGINIDYKNARSETALIQACYEGHLPVVRLLVEKGANLNLRDQDSWTALHWAAYSGNAELVKLLLHKGADTTILSKKGSTALQSAKKEDIKALFSAHGTTA